MKALFEDFGGKLDGVMELTKENIKKAEDFCYDASRNYHNFVLSIRWDDEKEMMVVCPDGPWEC